MEAAMQEGREAGNTYLIQQENVRILRERGEKREVRDMVIAGAAGIGALGTMGIAAYMGVNPENITPASEVGKVMYGLIGITTANMFSPFAKIQNWFERKKFEKEGKIEKGRI